MKKLIIAIPLALYLAGLVKVARSALPALKSARAKAGVTAPLTVKQYAKLAYIIATYPKALPNAFRVAYATLKAGA